MEAYFEITTGQGIGAQPAMDAGEVVQQRPRGANKATSLVWTAARRVQALQPVVLHVVVHWPDSAAVRSIRALEVDRLDQELGCSQQWR